jgi:hypothetical protein
MPVEKPRQEFNKQLEQIKKNRTRGIKTGFPGLSKFADEKALKKFSDAYLLNKPSAKDRAAQEAFDRIASNMNTMQLRDATMDFAHRMSLTQRGLLTASLRMQEKGQILKDEKQLNKKANEYLNGKMQLEGLINNYSWGVNFFALKYRNKRLEELNLKQKPLKQVEQKMVEDFKKSVDLLKKSQKKLDEKQHQESFDILKKNFVHQNDAHFCMEFLSQKYFENHKEKFSSHETSELSRRFEKATKDYDEIIEKAINEQVEKGHSFDVLAEMIKKHQERLALRTLIDEKKIEGMDSKALIKEMESIIKKMEPVFKDYSERLSKYEQNYTKTGKTPSDRKQAEHTLKVARLMDENTVLQDSYARFLFKLEDREGKEKAKKMLEKSEVFSLAEQANKFLGLKTPPAQKPYRGIAYV